MNNNYKENTKSFFRYFDHILDQALTKIKVDQDTVLFQVLICSGIIDTLAKCSASPNFNNYERFTKFIENFCDWKEHSKISLPHLVRLLQIIPSPELEELRKFAYEKIDTWENGEIIYIERDPDYKEVYKLWPKDNKLKEPIEKVSLESLKHLSLLWKLRNSIVHEMRTLGYGTNALVTLDPGYHQMANYKDVKADDPLRTWELVFPIPFFKRIIRNGIKNLKEYYLKNRLDPFDRFEFGSFWIAEFNKGFDSRR